MDIKWSKSTCPYCGLGCGLEVGIEKGKIVKVRGMKGHPANDGNICSLPANYPPLFSSDDRITQPMIRSNGELRPVTWDDAIANVADRFRRIIDKHGPNAVAFYGGAIGEHKKNWARQRQGYSSAFKPGNFRNI